jgi:uncharacterized protein
MFWLAGILVFLAGWASQRGSSCAVAAVEELIAKRRVGRFLGFVFCAALAFTIYNIARLAGVPVTMRFEGSQFDLHVLWAGAFFGLGAWINGRCAMGTLARLCSGEAARFGTIAGFLGGAFLAAKLGMRPPLAMMVSVLEQIAPALALSAGAAAAIILARLTRAQSTPIAGHWPPVRSMSVIGLASGLLLLVEPGWPYTGVLVHLGRMEMVPRPALVFVLLCFAGGISGALVSRTFSLDRGTGKAWSMCIGGGMLMGVGATLLPGGNDRMLLVGLPLLLPNLVGAYLAMLATLMLLFAARLQLVRS